MMLYDTFETFKQFQGLDFFKNYAMGKPEVLANLNTNMVIREYQKEALGRFYYYFEKYPQRQSPTHLMFNMATGSGKTYIMAASIIYLFEQGYRNFVFFTRLGNIVEKTKSNFMDKGSSKYLFADSLLINGINTKIREVENFDSVDPDAINIMFATTALLHTRLNGAQENAITYEDLKDKRIVLIADEAHNLSAETTSTLTSGETEDRSNWENTVLRLLNSNHSSENVLLEFTATARLETEYPEILEKYKDKALFRYDLKEFRLDKYSKDVKTLQIDAPILDRALSALVISQYRLKIAEKHKIRLKPIVMFKANRVTAPRDATFDNDNPQVVISRVFKAAFHSYVDELTVYDLTALRDSGNPTLLKAFDLFDVNQISMDDLLEELKRDFSPENCLTVDDDKDAVEKQRLLNSLEDADNHIRAIFATEKLNEGWDVLNLYDIVRLYNSRDSSNNRAGKTTVQEAQLIGRGARYYPFSTSQDDDASRRKFDLDTENELRILEQLFYHSVTNPRYIQELESVLVQDGIMASKTVSRDVTIKNAFKESEIWKNGVIYLNSKEEIESNSIASLEAASITFDETDEANFFELKSFSSVERDMFGPNTVASAIEPTVILELKLSDLGLNVLRFALLRVPGRNFENLNKTFGGLQSIEQFLSSSDYLGGVRVKVKGTSAQLANLDQDAKLEIASFVLSRVLGTAGQSEKKFRGTKLFKAHQIREVFGHDKTLQLDADSPRAKEIQDFNFANKDWFAQNEIWGTSEEESFIKFLDQAMESLTGKYDSIVLLRNEQYFSLFNFQDGAAFCPDFLLLLRDKKSSKEFVQQVFIEPKGNQFLDSSKRFEQSKEGWKQNLLLGIDQDIELDLKFENEEYRLVGLPFYNAGFENADLKDEFVTAFEENLLL